MVSTPFLKIFIGNEFFNSGLNYSTLKTKMQQQIFRLYSVGQFRILVCNLPFPCGRDAGILLLFSLGFMAGLQEFRQQYQDDFHHHH